MNYLLGIIAGFNICFYFPTFFHEGHLTWMDLFHLGGIMLPLLTGALINEQN